jgi:hypothetical protein
MSLSTLTQEDLRAGLGLEIDSDGLPAHAGIARLARLALSRWMFATPDRMRAYITRQLGACEMLGSAAQERVKTVLDRLELIRDVERVTIDGRTHLARTEPCWIQLTESSAVLTGTLPDAPVDTLPCPSDLHDGLDALVRRFDPRPEETQAQLIEHGIEQRELRHWLGVPDYRTCLERWGYTGDLPVAQLRDLWECLCERLTQRGMPVGSDASIRYLTGAPGEFFGKYRPRPSGRWSEEAEDGTWAAVRGGHSEHHWTPCVIRVEGGSPTSTVDLYDQDELRWAILARGAADSASEQLIIDGDEVRLTFWPPQQVDRLMALIGIKQEGWLTWRLPHGGVEHLQDLCGLR